MIRLLLLLFLFPLSLAAQGNLSGKITNLSGEPFGYCKLILVKDSVALQTTETDSLGNYLMQNTSEGDYHLQIKIPFEKIDTLITISGPTTFNLQIDEGNNLQDVEIKGERPMVIRKVDRTIFDPSNIPALIGGDASDVIEFAPGVYINGDDIRVAGGGSAQVMLNDKLIPLRGAELISFIRSIPTEDIQFIEIIPIPPVKYAASVQGSLINIKLVMGAKSRQSNGSISGDLGQRFYTQPGVFGNYSYRSGKFSLYSNISYSRGKYRYLKSKSIEYDTLLWKEKGTNVSQSDYLSGGLGLNYVINPSTEIGVLAVIYGYSNNYSDKGYIEERGSNNSTYAIINNLTSGKHGSQQTAVNLNLTKHLDSTGRKLDFNADYTDYTRKGQIQFQTETADTVSSERNQRNSLAHLLSGGVDYVHPLKKVVLNLGGRYSYSVNNSQLDVYNDVINPDLKDTTKSNRFDYYEQIQAAYASVDWKVKRWSFQIGLRGENTIYQGKSPTTGLLISNNYFQLVPKLFAMFESKNGQFWNFNLSRNFIRPDYSNLNPFRYYTSAYSFTTGNPYLKPIIMNDLSVSTTIGDLQFYFSLGYMEKMFTDVTVYNNTTQVQQTTVSNLFSSRSADFSLNYYKLIKKRTSIDLYMSCFYTNRIVEATISTQNLKTISGFFNLNFTQTLDKKQSFVFKTSLSYMAPYLEQISLTTMRPFMDFQLKKTLLRNRISLELSVSDPFKLQLRESITTSNNNIVRESLYPDSQCARFSFTYKLGNNNLNVNRHSTNSTGEAGRIGN